MIEKVTIYKTSDGAEFKTIEQANCHERGVVFARWLQEYHTSGTYTPSDLAAAILNNFDPLPTASFENCTPAVANENYGSILERAIQLGTVTKKLSEGQNRNELDPKLVGEATTLLCEVISSVNSILKK